MKTHTLRLTTAVELTSTHRKKIIAAIQKKTGTPFSEIRETVDPTVIGGIKITLGNTEYDGTIKGKLHKVYQEMSTQSQ